MGGRAAGSNDPGVSSLGKNVNLTYTTTGEFRIAVPETAGIGVSGSTTFKEGEDVSMPIKPVGQDWTSSVNAEYIAKFGPLGAQINPRVRLYMQTGFPFAAEYRDNAIKVAFYLVPRVQVSG